MKDMFCLAFVHVFVGHGKCHTTRAVLAVVVLSDHGPIPHYQFTTDNTQEPVELESVENKCNPVYLKDVLSRLCW